MTTTTTTITGVYHGPIFPPLDSSFDLTNVDITGGITYASRDPHALFTSTIEMTGGNTFNLVADSQADITVQLSHELGIAWTGSFTMRDGGFLTVFGNHGSPFYNDGASVANHAAINIDAGIDLQGTGSITLNSSSLAIDPNPVLGLPSIGSGQTFILGADSVINLSDIAAAASYSFRHDLLSLYNAAGQTVGTLKMDTDRPFSVSFSSATDVASVYTGHASHPAGETALTQGSLK
jgi:hypothetical protein